MLEVSKTEFLIAVRPWNGLQTNHVLLLFRKAENGLDRWGLWKKEGDISFLRK